ncbi:MAG: hypothetical protein ACXACP_14470 [Candidatus Hodarchaeales archaeon]
MREEVEWQIEGFTEEIRGKIEAKLLEDQNSYWFRFRSISWFRKRRIKGKTPEVTLTEVIKELEIDAKITFIRKNNQSSSYWLIEPK